MGQTLRGRHPDEYEENSTKPPREMGVLLIALGISELIPPEPIGMVFVVLGGLVFWPRRLPSRRRLARAKITQGTSRVQEVLRSLRG